MNTWALSVEREAKPLSLTFPRARPTWRGSVGTLARARRSWRNQTQKTPLVLFFELKLKVISVTCGKVGLGAVLLLAAREDEDRGPRVVRCEQGAAHAGHHVEPAAAPRRPHRAPRSPA